MQRETPRLNFVVQRLLVTKEALIGCFVAMSFSWSVVEVLGDLVALVLGDFGHGYSFGEILPDQPVGVLVGPALPTVVRGCEVELGRADCFHLAVPVELGPVVRVMVRIRPG